MSVSIKIDLEGSADAQKALANVATALGSVSNAGKALDTGNWTKGMMDFQAAINAISSGSLPQIAGLFGETGKVVGGVIQTVQKLVGTFIDFAKETASTGEMLLKLSKQTGISVESLSALKYAAELSETSIQAVTFSLGYLSKQLAFSSEDSSATGKSLTNLGISAKDTAGKIKPMEVLLMEISDKFSMMKDGSEKTAISMGIFGRSGKELIPLLNEGSSSIKTMMEKAKELGITFTTEAAEAADEFGDNLITLNSRFTGLKQTIGNWVIPIFNDLLKTWDEFGKAKMDQQYNSKELIGITKHVNVYQKAIADVESKLVELKTTHTQVLESMKKGAGDLNENNKAVNALWKEIQSLEGQLKTLQSTYSETGKKLGELTEREKEVKVVTDGLAKALKINTSEAVVFGKEFNKLEADTGAYKEAILALLTQGLSPTTAEVKRLIVAFENLKPPVEKSEAVIFEISDVLGKLGFGVKTVADVANAFSLTQQRAEDTRFSIDEGAVALFSFKAASVGIEEPLETTAEKAKRVKEELQAWLKGMQDFQAGLSAIASGSLAQIAGLFGETGKMIGGIIQLISNIDKLPELLSQSIDALANGADKFADAIIKVITDLVPKLPAILQKIVMAVINALPAIATALIKAVGPFTIELVKAMPSVIVALIKAAPEIITALIHELPTLIKEIVHAIPEIIAAFVHAIPEVIGVMAEGMYKVALELVNAIISLIGELATAFYQLGGQIFEGLWDGVSILWDWFYNLGKQVVNGIKDTIGGVFNIGGGGGVNLGGGGDLLNYVVNPALGVTNDAVGAIGNVLGFATGGIVTKPTFAMVGEAGPEVIIPLSKAGQYLGGGGITVQNIFNGPVVWDEISASKFAKKQSQLIAKEYAKYV